ncbi:hypothetical protein OPT61_g9340 [Boeremia exigua]|uniref:Uncharacterized protein n=1 Tax=Boeremia exigua TaxID=749465 RepID=A0ACC2HW47_9PLEO|nr:hypothetical protein OPT61_g9340 [Boeremia exigua]
MLVLAGARRGIEQGLGVEVWQVQRTAGVCRSPPRRTSANAATVPTPRHAAATGLRLAEATGVLDAALPAA